MKKRIAESVIMRLGDRYTREQKQEIAQTIYLCMEGYSVTETGEKLVQYRENENDKMFRLFLITKKIEGCTEKTIKFYADQVKKLGVFLKKNWEDVTADDIRLYIAHMAIDRKCSKATQDNSLRVYRSFFGWLASEEHIKKDPTKRVKKIRQERKVRKAFSEIEIEKLRNGARNLRERAIIEVLLSTGVRVSELEGMNRKDLDGDQMIVYGKGEKERYVYLNAKAIVALENYLKTRDDEEEALFVSILRPHKRLEKGRIEQLMRELGKAVGVQDVHPHRFRRTAATVALNRGMPIDQVQQMLGHEQISTTTIYAKTLSESVKANHKKYLA